MFAAVVTVSNEASLVEGVRLLQPALAVLDLGLTSDGLDALRRLRELRPEQKIILLSPHDSRIAAEAALAAGADGYVLKQSIAEDLLAAAETVLAGGRYCSPRVAGVLALAPNRRRGNRGRVLSTTGRRQHDLQVDAVNMDYDASRGRSVSNLIRMRQ